VKFRLISFGEIETKKHKEKHKTQDEDNIQDTSKTLCPTRISSQIEIENMGNAQYNQSQLYCVYFYIFLIIFFVMKIT